MGDYTKKVIEAILACGFVEIGSLHYPSGKISKIAGNRFVAASISTRRRFRKGNRFITVGKRTTCLYEVNNLKPTNFINFDSKDLAGIKAAIGDCIAARKEER